MVLAYRVRDAAAAVGVPPDVDAARPRLALDDAGLGGHDVKVQLVGGTTELCRARQAACTPISR